MRGQCGRRVGGFRAVLTLVTRGPVQSSFTLKKLIALFLPKRYQKNRIAKVFDIYCENSSYFFFSKVIFTRKEMVIFPLMLAKICLLNKFSSQLVCRKRIFVAWKCSHETIIWVWDPKTKTYGFGVISKSFESHQHFEKIIHLGAFPSL